MPEGPRYPGSAVVVDTGQYDDRSWSSPSGIFADDGSNASCSLSPNPYDDSEYLDAKSFGFSLPADTVSIDGIAVEVDCRSTLALNTVLTVRALKAGTTAGTAKSVSPIPTSFTTVTLGGPTDLWGTTWAKSDIEHVSTGLRLRATLQVASSATVYVDFVRVTVYITTSAEPLTLTAPAGPGPSVPTPNLIRQLALAAPAGPGPSVVTPNVVALLRPAVIDGGGGPLEPEVSTSVVYLSGEVVPPVGWSDSFDSHDPSGWDGGAETAGGGTVTVA